MTYFMYGKSRYLVLLAALIVLALISTSGRAQARKPAVEIEEEKIEQRQAEAPAAAQPARRRSDSLEDIARRIPERDKLREFDCSGTETVQFLPIDMYPLSLVRGDAELGGSPDMEIKVSVTHTAGRIFLRGHVELDEPDRGGAFSGSPDTTFRGTFVYDNIVPKSGCIIAKTRPSSGEISDWATYHHDWDMFYGSGLIESANCRLDTGGDDAGKVGCKQIKLRPINIKYQRVVENRECRSMRITPRVEAIYPLHRRRSGPHGKDMNGHRVDIFLDSHVEIIDTPEGHGQVLSIKSNLKLADAEERAGRAMRVYGDGGQTNVFVTKFDAPGCRIVDVRPNTGTLRAKSFAGNHKFTEYSQARGDAQGMIEYANCRTDTRGNDSGKIGCTEIVYKPLTIVLEKE